MRLPVVFAVLAAVTLPLACSSSSNDEPAAVAADGGTGGDDAGRAPDSTTGGDAASASCTGACMLTSLSGTFGDKSGAFTRAQHGVETGASGEPLLYLEAHAGGSPACPDQNSPAPERTLILANVPRGQVGETFTKADGVTAAILDFDGALGLPPTTKATAVEVKLVAVDAANPPAFVALDVTATFPEGTVTGHAYASYCDSLSK